MVIQIMQYLAKVCMDFIDTDILTPFPDPHPWLRNILPVTSIQLPVRDGWTGGFWIFLHCGDMTVQATINSEEKLRQ
ncbi:MAG: hypothetical protein CMN78_04565 [Spirochaetales bacterium]|nr:hypothetical protein [Spirochaetales bacterium]